MLPFPAESGDDGLELSRPHEVKDEEEDIAESVGKSALYDGVEHGNEDRL